MEAVLGAVTFGFMIGLSGIVPPGPVFVYLLQQSLQRGLKGGFYVILASAVVGITILLLIIQTSIGIIFSSPLFDLYIGFIGGISLLILGVLIFRSSFNSSLIQDLNGTTPSFSHPFVGGLVVNALNPQVYLWWLVIGIPSLGFANDLSGVSGIYGWVVGVYLSLLTWYGGISYMVSRGRQYIPHKAIIVISLLSGIFLILSGIYLLARYTMKF